jgi:mRNA interferase MazF
MRPIHLAPLDRTRPVLVLTRELVSCDNIVTVPTSALGRQVGRLRPEQETALTAALHGALNLEDLPAPR